MVKRKLIGEPRQNDFRGRVAGKRHEDTTRLCDYVRCTVKELDLWVAVPQCLLCFEAAFLHHVVLRPETEIVSAAFRDKPVQRGEQAAVFLIFHKTDPRVVIAASNRSR